MTTAVATAYRAFPTPSSVEPRRVVVPVERPKLDELMARIDARLAFRLHADPEAYCLIGKFPHGVKDA